MLARTDKAKAAQRHTATEVVMGKIMAPLKIAVIGVALNGLAAAAGAAAPQSNATGLPTYPHDADGIMDATYRSLPNGQHCISYMSSSGDALGTVQGWYKKQLPNAKVDDINHNSIFGNYFKLNGIKLLSGDDMVNVYADTDRNRTTIELYKCRDAATPAT
jgi:hypothetical protein